MLYHILCVLGLELELESRGNDCGAPGVSSMKDMSAVQERTIITIITTRKLQSIVLWNEISYNIKQIINPSLTSQHPNKTPPHIYKRTHIQPHTPASNKTQAHMFEFNDT